MSDEIDDVTAPATPSESDETPAASESNAPAEEAAALDPEDEALIAPTAIEVPNDERLVPESALKAVASGLRAKLREARAGTQASEALKTELEQVKAQLAQLKPAAEAFEALRGMPAQAQPTTTVPDPLSDPELGEIARDLDLFNTDGSLDLERAQRIRQRELRSAQAIAQQQTAPLVEHTLRGQAAYNLERAKNTTLPNGDKADPAVLDALVAQVAAQPGGLQSLADQKVMLEIWKIGYGQTMAMKAMQPASSASREPAPPLTLRQDKPPVVVESASGTRAAGPKISDRERKWMRDAGISEKEYAEISAKTPW